MNVRFLTKEDVEDAKTLGAKRKERWSFFGRTNFDSDAGRGALFLTKRTRTDEAEASNSVRITGFLALSEADRRVYIVQTYEDLLKKMARQRVCKACGIEFTFAAELGRRNCAWHPGKIGPGERWTCCNKGWRPHEEGRKNGCCMCDHNSRYNHPARPASVVLPLLVAEYLGIPESAIPEQQRRKRAAPSDMCSIDLTTKRRFAGGEFVYTTAPLQSDLMPRPLSDAMQLVKNIELAINAFLPVSVE